MRPQDADLLSKAINYATCMHDGQYRRGTGDPYIVHPLRVMQALQDFPVHVRIAAVLHDVVEDTLATLPAIEARFGGRVATLVDALTRREAESYSDFIMRVNACGGEAIAIKRADITDNLRDLEGSLRKRYTKALDILADGRP